MRASRLIALGVLALLAAGREAAASCALPHQVASVEAALSGTFESPPGPARRAALAEARRLIDGAGDGSAEVSAWLSARAAALGALERGDEADARERLSRFDFTALAEKVAAEAAAGGCPEWLGPSGPGDRSEREAAEAGGAAREDATRGSVTSLASAGRVVNRSGSILPKGDALTPALLAALIVVPFAGLAAYRVRALRRRREGRYACYLPASLGGRYREESAQLVDFSRSGARLSVEAHMLEIGEKVEVEYAGLRRAAFVRWTRRRSVGLRLCEPLSDSEFDAVLGAAQAGAGAGRL